MQNHIRLVCILFIAFGFLGVIAAGIVFIAIAGGGVLSGSTEALAITTMVASVIASIILVFSIPGIIGGSAVLAGKSWGRTFLMIFAAMQLIVIPFGTALGIYALWALTTPSPSTPVTPNLEQLPA